MKVTVPSYFVSSKHAWEHVCDHVLTRPEAHDWALVIPGYREIVDPADDAGLRKLAGSFWTAGGLGSEAKRLQDAYIEAIVQAAVDALQMGWWWARQRPGPGVLCGFGLDGVYVVWQSDLIRTGMLPRNARYAGSGPIDRRIDPLPRRRQVRLPGQPPPGSRDARFRLFRDNLARVSKEYANAYISWMSAGAGASVFVDGPPSFEEWQRWLDQRALRLEIHAEDRS
jgi:hypothetical protein